MARRDATKIPASFSFLLIIFLTPALSFAQINSPASSALPTVGKIAGQIESRRSAWIVLKAKLMVHFYQEGRQRASCLGQFLYDRIEEKAALSCVDHQNKLLFVFKTLDRQFELYLPAARAVYEGNIFVLSDSPDIESHLKPLDLYRALKPLAIPLDEAAVESQDKDYTGLKVYAKRHDKPYLARRLLATSEGDVPFEIYYSENEEPATIIRRSDYRKIPLPDEGSKEKVVFPRQIEIESAARKNKTLLLFKKIEFPSRFLNETWGNAYPKDVKRIPVEDPAVKRQMVFEKAPAV